MASRATFLRRLHLHASLHSLGRRGLHLVLLGVGATGCYVLGAGSGQPLVLNAAGEAGNDPALIITSLPQGKVLLADSPWRSFWTIVLTKTQDSLVQIENGGPATRYYLNVVVPALVRLPAQGGTTARSGPTPFGLPVDCAVHARTGQRLVVSLQSTADSATLKVIGLVSGGSYVAENGVSREEPTDHLVFTAREDVDYVVSIVPPADTIVHYTVTFKVSG